MVRVHASSLKNTNNGIRFIDQLLQAMQLPCPFYTHGVAKAVCMPITQHCVHAHTTNRALAHTHTPVRKIMKMQAPRLHVPKHCHPTR